MDLAKALEELKSNPGLLDTSEGKQALLALAEEVLSRLEVLEDLAGERQTDVEELFCRLEDLESDLQTLADESGFEFDDFTTEDLDDATLEVPCPGCEALLMVHMGEGAEEVTCPECGEEFTVELDGVEEEEDHENLY